MTENFMQPCGKEGRTDKANMAMENYVLAFVLLMSVFIAVVLWDQSSRKKEKEGAAAPETLHTARAIDLQKVAPGHKKADRARAKNRKDIKNMALERGPRPPRPSRKAMAEESK